MKYILFPFKFLVYFLYMIFYIICLLCVIPFAFGKGMICVHKEYKKGVIDVDSYEYREDMEKMKQESIVELYDAFRIDILDKWKDSISKWCIKGFI